MNSTAAPTYLMARSSKSAKRISLLPVTCPQCDILHDSYSTVKAIVGSTRVDSDRLIYALAGILFNSKSPKPFGGPKMKSGFLNYCGTSPSDLLEYIITDAYKEASKSNSTKALKFVVNSVNRLTDLHFRGMKDEVDELMLRGMRKAGHIDWFKAANIPLRLKHFDEDGIEPQGVLFSFPSDY
ncbi:hypothetical protein BDR26DRAFT_850155 [Obelidium mucronatum]|nr:hypothetical protein BDR26DRAFT_850155 [Obelidium mucronatum]